MHCRRHVAYEIQEAAQLYSDGHKPTGVCTPAVYQLYPVYSSYMVSAMVSASQSCVQCCVDGIWKDMHSGATKQVHCMQPNASHQTLIAQNPFRTPEVLERTRGTRLRAMKDSARGPKLFYIDLKVHSYTA